MLSKGDSPVDRDEKHQQKNVHYQSVTLSPDTRRTHRLGRATQRQQGLMANKLANHKIRTCGFTPLFGWEPYSALRESPVASDAPKQGYPFCGR